MFKNSLEVFNSIREDRFKGQSLTDIAKHYKTTGDSKERESCIAEIVVRMSPVINNAIYKYPIVESASIVSGSLTALMYALKKYDIESNKRFEMFYKGTLHSTYMRLLKETTYQKNKVMHNYISTEHMKEEHGIEYSNISGFNDNINLDRLINAPYVDRFDNTERDMYEKYLTGEIRSIQEYIDSKKDMGEIITYAQAYKAFKHLRNKIDIDYVKSPHL